MSSISAGTTSGTALVSTGDTTGTLDLKTGAGATTALSIDASQRVGIGTSSPTQKLDVSGKIRGYLNNTSVGNASSAQFVQDGTGDAAISFLIGATTEWLAGVDNSDSDSFKISNITGGGDFTSTGLTLTTSGVFYLGPKATNFSFTNGSAVDLSGSGTGLAGNGTNLTLGVWNGPIVFQAGNSGGALVERARIDSSGNLLIGGTTSYGKLTTYVGNNSRFAATTSSGAGGGAGGWQLPAYYGSVKVNYIDCELTDGTGGSEASVMRFATIGSGTLAERMRIDSSGAVLAGTTSASISSSGLKYEGANGALLMVRDGNTPFAINRLTNDGNLIEFYQASSLEGTISVSGTTVSYNGGHLSRWSQTTDNTRIPLVKGTVMSNLDQMANWDGQANEQLNCMKVSDVEGDVNVAGVFVNWDNDDDEFTNDVNIAMTGDMIIRIAQGTVVQRGDLLMSAGDGTAKPQGDDIVRSKTVAKVTSTHITCTYDDGSYCVPCVLMAC